MCNTLNYSELKSIISILLLISFTVPFGGSYILLQYQKRQVKKEIKERIISGIDKNDLVVFKLSKKESETELLWEHSGEFEYRGEMYDIVHSEEKGDTIFYWCWWDYKETKLNKQLDNLVAQAMGHNPGIQANTKSIATFLFSLFIPKTVEWDAFTRFQYAAQPPANSLYSSIKISPPIPPP